MNDYYYIQGLSGKAICVGLIMDAIYDYDDDLCVLLNGKTLIHHINGFDNPLVKFVYSQSDASLHIVKLHGIDALPLPW